MIIQCPHCQSRYSIDPSRSTKDVARVKCPGCKNIFAVTLRSESDSAPGETVAPSAAPRQSSPPPSPNLPGERVLIIDDANFFREMIADVLKPLDLRITTAADGDEGLDRIRHERPDLVILDLNLPGMSGYDIIREVRKDPSVAGIRLLAMSGVYRREADAAQATDAGADAFMNKSFKPQQLQDLVKRLLAGEKV